MNINLSAAYDRRYEDILVPCATALQRLLEGYVNDLSHIDRVSVRAKSPAKFLEKAAKMRGDGSLKYADPTGQIQDQIGARIIVFYLSDVEPTSERVLRYFRHIEETSVEPESDAEFGYFGRHYILMLPEDVIPRGVVIEDAPKVFELQVRTLFQHAWSEAEHDIGYKPGAELTSDQRRRFAFTAAQAWGADRVFQELYQELKT